MVTPHPERDTMTDDTSMGAVHRALGRIEGKIDGIDARLQSGSIRMDKLEARVADNEKRVWKMAGATGVIAAITVLMARMVPWVQLLS